MDQLVVLQEIYASFSKGIGALKKIDVMSIKGCCSDLVGRLLESSINGRIDEDICRKLSEELQDVYELKRLGDICRKAGQTRLAIDAYRRAITLCQDPVLSPVLQNNLGQAYAGQGDLARAISCYQKASEVFTREGDRTGLAHVLGNLGSAYRKAGEWRLAIDHAQRSRKIFEEDGDRLGMAQMSGSIGRIYAEMGEEELAARCFQRSLAEFERLGDKRGAAWILDRLGRMAGEKRDWDKAISYMHSSISIWEEMGESGRLGGALSELGGILLQMGQPYAARGPLERGVMLVPEHSRPNHQRALYNLARTYSALAEASMKEALTEENSENEFEEEKRREASRLFAQSADRYQELADALPQRKREIRARASLTRSLSYLSRISEEMADREVLMLAEKAKGSLDNAAADLDGEKRAGAVALQNIVSGLGQAFRLDAQAEGGEANGAVSDFVEQLLAAASSWSSGEARGFLRQALESIRLGMERKTSRSQREEELQTAASALFQAKESLEMAEGGSGDASARMMERAAGILEEMDGMSKGEEDAGMDVYIDGEEGISPDLDCLRERSALLAISAAMMIRIWQDLEKEDEKPGREDRHSSSIDGKEGEESIGELACEDDLAEEPGREPPARSDLPEGEGEGREKELVLADGSREVLSPSFSAREEQQAGKRSSNLSGQGLSSGGQLLLPEERPPLERGVLFRPAASSEAYAGREERFWAGDRQAAEMEEAAERAERIPPFAEYPREKNRQPFHKEAVDWEIEATGPELGRAEDDLEAEMEAQNPLSPKAVLLLKVLTALVLVMLLIETMLYLI